MINLNRINLAKIQDGGYSISLSSPPALEANQAILLRVGTSQFCIDITGGYTKDKLPALLEAIARNGIWGQQITCTAMLVKFENLGTPGGPNFWKGDKALILYPNMQYAVMRAITILQQSSRTLAAPVKPYMAPNPVPLTWGSQAAIAIGNATPSFPYIKVNGKGAGRMLSDNIGGRYYLYLRDTFETDNTKRGFDCTTYVLSAYRPTGTYKGGAGDEVAQLICGAATGNNNMSGDQLKAFFAANPTGEHIMWHKETDEQGTVTSGHVVIVINGVVHQYSSASMTYLATPVASYDFGGHSWSTRPVPGTGATNQPVPKTVNPAQPSIGAPQTGAPKLPPTSPSYRPQPANPYMNRPAGPAPTGPGGMRGVVNTYRP